MNPDSFLKLLSPVAYAKTVYMKVYAVSTYEKIRFMLNDFSTGPDEASEYVLNISELKDSNDRKGKHLGQPIDIDAKIVEQALNESAQRGYTAEETERFVISHVLAHGDIVKKLRNVCGSCPRQIRHLFQNAKAVNEQQELANAVSDPTETSNYSAAPVKSKSL
jgi:hypothetical protein